MRSRDWRRKHLNALSSTYARAKFFEEAFPILQEEYLSAGAETLLADVNISLIKAICAYLGFMPTVRRS